MAAPVHGELLLFAFGVWRSCRQGEPRVNFSRDKRFIGAARAFDDHLGHAGWTWRDQGGGCGKPPPQTPASDHQPRAEGSAQSVCRAEAAPGVLVLVSASAPGVALRRDSQTLDPAPIS